MRRNDGWDVGAVRERCQHLKATLQGRASVSSVELADYWPGGAANPERRGRGPWLFCYASYARLMGRAEAASAASDTQEALLTALAADPVPVTLTDGAEHACHPKSYHALRWMAHADALLGAMLHVMDRIPYFETTQQDALREDALAGTTTLQLALVWAAVHPGVGLPFDPTQTIPDPPEWIRAMTPFDLYQVLRAYREANLRGLAALPALTDGEPSGTRPTFALFFASLATETGVSSDALMRERPLAQLLAQARLTSLAREPAKAGA